MSFMAWLSPDFALVLLVLLVERSRYAAEKTKLEKNQKQCITPILVQFRAFIKKEYTL